LSAASLAGAALVEGFADFFDGADFFAAVDLAFERPEEDEPPFFFGVAGACVAVCWAAVFERADFEGADLVFPPVADELVVFSAVVSARSSARAARLVLEAEEGVTMTFRRGAGGRRSIR